MSEVAGESAKREAGSRPKAMQREASERQVPWPARVQGGSVAAFNDDSGAVEQARDGNPEAFAAIVVRHEAAIYNFCYRMTGNHEDADDVTQECFIRAFHALPRTTRELNVPAWLHRIAANACIDLLRRRQRIRWLPWDLGKHERLLPGSQGDEPEHATLGSETQAVVQEILRRMQPRHRAVLLLREFDGLQSKEIAQALGLSTSAVNSLLFRAREEFRRLYHAVEGRRDADS